MKKIHLLLTALFLLAMLCSCSSTYYLYSSPETKNEVVSDRGDEYQVAESDENNLTFMAAGLDTDNGDNRIVFAIMNGSSSTYPFSDSQITIFGGNAETDEWNYIQNWDAAGFYDRTVAQAEAEQTAAAILGVLSVVDAAFGSSSYSTVYTPYGPAVFTTRSNTVSDVVLTAMAASIYNMELAIATKENLAYLKENLLFSSAIEAGKTYSGLIYFPGDRVYADYKIAFEDPAGVEEFIFAKSNREEILHPWTADATRVLNAVTLNFSPFSDRLGLYYHWLPPRGVGFYTGLSFYGFKERNLNTVSGYYHRSLYGSGAAGNFSFSFDPDPTDSHAYYDYDGRFTEKECVGKSLALPMGMTIKIAKHSWLLAGISFVFGTDTYYIGKLEYSANGGPYKVYSQNAAVGNPDSFGIEVQLGANFVFNFIDFGVIANYDILLRRFAVDLCAGVAL